MRGLARQAFVAVGNDGSELQAMVACTHADPPPLTHPQAHSCEDVVRMAHRKAYQKKSQDLSLVA